MEIKIGSWEGRLDVVDIYKAPDEDGELIDWMLVRTHYSKVVKEKVIKGMQDCKWMGGSPPNWIKDKAYYKVPLNSRNRFHLDYYNKHTPNPYAPYRCELESAGMKPRFSKKHNRIVEPLPHQVLMADHWWTRKVCHVAGDMRTGKTLSFLTVAEKVQAYTWIVAPRTAVAAIKLEIFNWGIELDPEIFTYNELVSLLKKESSSLTPPRVIIFDESHYLKNWSTDRTKACWHACEEMRKKYKDPGNYYILGQSGTAIPKNPVDLWAQVEVIRPGYIPESSPKKLDERLSIIEYRDNATGGQYPHRLGWKESDDICALCGKSKDEHVMWDHEFVAAKNEIEIFNKSLKGFTIRVLKSECMNLPEKIMERVKLKPTREMLQFARTIKQSGAMAATVLSDLLQLSAGFYYEFVPDVTKIVTCPRCNGLGLIEDENGNKTRECTMCCNQESIEGMQILLPGRVYASKRVAVQIECPKEQLMIDQLEECDEAMRFVGFGSFHGAIDRMTSIALAKGWEVIQVDGRGFNYFGSELRSSVKNDSDALFKFSSKEIYKNKLAYIGHSGSGGTGVSLSSSPTIFYWCNSFDGGARMQSIERGSDLGMDMARGCKIVDAICLSVDEYVLDNLDRKEKLQSLTLDELDKMLTEVDDEM